MGRPARNPLRPFTAVDIAPPARPRATAPLGPAVSPFLDNLQGPFLDAKETAEPEPRDLGFPASESPPEDDFLPALRPAPPAPVRVQEQPASSPDPAPSGTAIRPRFFMTTTPGAGSHAIHAFLDVLSAEAVIPKDLLFRNPAPYGELHRLKAAEDHLQKVKAQVMEELAEKARKAGADAVVGVQVTFASLDTVCCLCSASGTAVKLA